MKRVFLLLMMFFLFGVFTVHAAESVFNTGITSEKNQIFSNESARYTLTIYSSSSRIETFSIYTDVEWSLSTSPAEDKNLKVYPATQKQTTILIKPKNEARIFPGAYAVRIYLKNTQSGEVITNNVILYVKGEGGFVGNYLPSIRTELEIGEQIDPRQPIQVKILLENQNPLDIESMDIFIQSDLFVIQDTTTLAALEKKELTYSTKISDLQSQREDRVKLTLSIELKERVFEFNSIPTIYEIISYGTVVEEKIVDKSFLKRKITYLLKNTANSDQTYELQLRRNIFKIPFSHFDRDPALKKIEGKSYYFWPTTIPVGQDDVIIEYVNYRPLVTTLLILLGLFLLYIAFRSPVLINKTMVVTSQRHGGIAGINVQVDIKNRSPKSISLLRIKDKVPNMFRLDKEFEIGTLHPYQILKHEKKGTIVKWKVDDLEPFEERIITYRLNSKLNIIGKFALPRVSLTYKSGNKTKIIHSNKVFMSKR